MAATLSELLQPGAIGLYDHVDLVEVIVTTPERKTFNLLTIAAFGEDEAGDAFTEPADLTGRLKVPGLKDWCFGVYRSRRPCSSIGEAITQIHETGCWSASGKPLPVGILEPQQPLFVPPDGTVRVPVNRLLKNNIWNGSHLLRLLNLDKKGFDPFLAERRRLQQVSDLIAPAVPLELSGLPDFLGDILIQLPVTAVVSDIGVPRDGEHVQAQITWHPKVADRDLQMAARMRNDEALSGAAVSSYFRTTTVLPVSGHVDPVEAELWDTESGRILAATASTSTIQTIVANICIAELEPRTFLEPDRQGSRTARRVSLKHLKRAVVGEQQRPAAERWRSERVQMEEAWRLERTREFVQYRPVPGSNSEQDRAFADVRLLIERHGTHGVDLWDPYLDADDLLRTLFWCPHFNSPMRALSAGAEQADQPGACSAGKISEPAKAAVPFTQRERSILDRDSGNRHGLRLEFRRRSGLEGWSFHDRFLIFPSAEDGPLAWSLGTSVNSLGKAHHILQRVSNASLIAGAFDDLWKALGKGDHLVWKSF